FRRVLRSEFPDLCVEERVTSNDESECSYQCIQRYVEEHGAPMGIYNVAAENIGIARALRDAALEDKVIFIGHELNANSRMLLESGRMDLVVGHDLDREVAQSFEVIAAYLSRTPLPSLAQTQVRIYTKYS